MPCRVGYAAAAKKAALQNFAKDRDNSRHGYAKTLGQPLEAQHDQSGEDRHDGGAANTIKATGIRWTSEAGGIVACSKLPHMRVNRNGRMLVQGEQADTCRDLHIHGCFVRYDTSLPCLIAHSL